VVAYITYDIGRCSVTVGKSVGYVIIVCKHNTFTVAETNNFKVIQGHQRG